VPPIEVVPLPPPHPENVAAAASDNAMIAYFMREVFHRGMKER
jgi:hypothetical protein